MLVVQSLGCASIVSKKRYDVVFSTEPQGAVVTVRNVDGSILHRDTTPTGVRLSASAGYFDPAQYYVSYEKDGLQPVKQVISAKIDPYYIGNIVFGGLVGWLIVDPATGAMWQLEENQLAVMQKDAARTPKNPVDSPAKGKAIKASESPRKANDTKPDEAKLEEAVQPVAGESSAMPGVVQPNEDNRKADEMMRALHRLRELRDADILTVAEYELRRKELLEKILALE